MSRRLPASTIARSPFCLSWASPWPPPGAGPYPGLIASPGASWALSWPDLGVLREIRGFPGAFLFYGVDRWRAWPLQTSSSGSISAREGPPLLSLGSLHNDTYATHLHTLDNKRLTDLRKRDISNRPRSALFPGTVPFSLKNDRLCPSSVPKRAGFDRQYPIVISALLPFFA